MTRGYVDIHSHILHGLDDGARTMEESIALLEAAVAAGTSAIVATPHANGRYRFHPDVIDRQIEELRAHAPIEIFRGCDFHLQVDNIEDALAHPCKYTLNGHSYLLVEFPSHSIFPNSDDILWQLLDAGMIPVISHPERNPSLCRDLQTIQRWVTLGCYTQVTAASFSGFFGRTARAVAVQLLESGLAHFVASDAHDLVQRPPNLHDVYLRLAGAYGEDRIRPLFVDNPRAALSGEPLDVSAFPPLSGRRWYEFWR